MEKEVQREELIMNHLARLVCLTMLVVTAGLQAGEIHDAAASGDLQKVKALLEANPSLLESKADYGETPLISACSGSQVAVADFLIDNGANVNATNIYGVPVLNYAINDGDECLTVVQRLIDKGAEINVKNSDGGSPLHAAANRDNLKVAKLLLDYGADLNAPCRHGTPLQMKIMFGSASASTEKTAIFLSQNSEKPQEYSFGNNDLHPGGHEGLRESNTGTCQARR